MTADEVLEAMGLAIENQMACDDNTPTDLARAAIRTLPAGWVVAKVPEDETAPSVTRWGKGFVDGHNRALAAVRASAVEVEP